jgi:hypothetical protein
MKEKEILENNKLIAEFMGYKINEDLNFSIPTTEPFWNGSNIGEWGYHDKKDNYSIGEWNLCYNKSWDWLMPVVEKIENTHHYQDFIIGGSRVEIKSFSAFDDCFEKLIDEESKMEAVYVAIVEFIKWYNENK